MARQVLNERYKVETALGEGGMARVYRGTDQVLDRTVAIKVLADRYAEDDNFVTRFRREAQAAAALSHPNVVAVFDTGDDDAAHYIVMEYVEGRTLGEVLKVDGPLDADRASAITEDVATALQAAHQRGLVHRDVKPGNVMIDTEGRVKVMDFGIARAAANDTLTQTGTVLGTAAYLSPEQARGDSVDARSDIYSLGCVLFEMVAGRPPFTGDSPVSLAFRHVNEDPQPPSAYRPGVPPQLEAVVMRALEKDPGRRYQSAEEFRRALADFRGDGAATVPIGAPAPRGDTAVMPTAAETAADGAPPRPGPRVPWVPVALLAAAILVIAGFLALTQVAERDRGGRQGERRQGQGGEEQQPEPPDEVPSPQMALGAFDDLLTSAASQGAVTPEAAETIANKVDEAGTKYLEGDLEKALEELEKAHEEIGKAAESGEITSGDVADALHQGVDLIAASMEAAPPEVPTEGEDEEEGEGEEESSGEGNSEGKGKEGEGNGEGKGNGKGKNE